MFRNIEIPGIQNLDGMAMLFLHPCTMRDKGFLIERVTMVAVRKFPTAAGGVPGPSFWERAHFDKMPLYELEGPGCSIHVAYFLELGTVASVDLKRADRVAVLSVAGRLTLQQRITHHFTRLSPTILELRGATKGVEAEFEAQTDWVEAACDAAKYDANEANQVFDLDQAIDVATKEVSTWMDEPAQRVRLHSKGLSEIERLSETQRVVSDAAIESTQRHTRPKIS